MGEAGGYLPPVLEGYSVEAPSAVPALAPEAEATLAQEWKITLHGRNFFERAMMPVIRIGRVRVHKYEITPDGSAIVCYLQEVPEEGAEISVTYGPGMTATLPQRFSSSRVEGVPPASSEGGDEGRE